MPDTRIALSGIDNRPSPGPFATLGGLMQIKEQQAYAQERQQQAEIQRRNLEDDDAIRQTLPRYQRPDEAIDDLYKQGRATAAAKLGTSIYNQRKTQTEAYDQQLQSSSKRLEQATQIGQSINDDASYQAARPALIELLAPVYGDGIRDVLPTTYDAEHMKRLVLAGTKTTDRMRAEHEAAGDLMTAFEKGAISNPYAPGGQLNADTKGANANAVRVAPGQAGAQWSKPAMDVWDGYLKAASRVLPQADSKEQWDAYLTILHNQGAPDDVLRQIPQWDESNPAKSRKAAAQLGLNQKEQADIANQTKTREQESERIGLERERVQIAKQKVDQEAGGPQPKPLSASAQTQVDARRNTRNRALEKLHPDVKNESAAEQEQYADLKLQIENDHRNESRQKPFDEAAQDAVDSGDKASYDILAKKYAGATGGLRKLEDLVPWEGGTASPRDVNLPAEGALAPVPATAREREARYQQLKAELGRSTDPARRNAIKAEVAAIRAAMLQNPQ